MTRARSIEVYLKPGIDEDDVIHRVWEAVAARGRPQETFRRLLILGIRAAVENGEMPRAGLEAIDLDVLMPVGPATARMRAAAARHQRQGQPGPQTKDLTPEPVATGQDAAEQRGAPPVPRPERAAAPVKQTPVAAVLAATQDHPAAAVPEAAAPKSRLGRLM